MIDPGLLVIAIFVGLILMVIWSTRKKIRRRYPGGIVTRQPGERQEGAEHTGGSD